MMKHIRIFMASLVVFVGLGAAVPALASADTAKSTVCSTLGSDASCKSTPAGSTSLNSIISATINILSWVIGVAAVIMLMVGGFRFITASGDSNSVASARSTIIYALVGIVIAAFAQIMVQFVLNKL
jgi:hypothetical protein